LLYAALRARGWELRRVSALEGAAPVTFAKPLPFDSAPAVPISETGYTMWPSLRPHFWIPVFDDAGPTGRFGGPLTAGTAASWRGPAGRPRAAELEPVDCATSPDTALAAVCPGCEAQSLLGGSLTLTLTRLVNGALSISPEDGFAWSVTYRRREEPGTSRWSN